MRKSFKKSIALILAAITAMSLLTACGAKEEAADAPAEAPAATEETAEEVKEGEKITVTIGNWPSDARPEYLAQYEQMEKDFEAKYPQYDIVGDETGYDPKTFTMKATSGTLPNVIAMYFTGIESAINEGFCADISAQLEEMGWNEYINPQIADIITSDDGKIYGIPESAYIRGLALNKKLFTEAGLVNADGSLMIPETWDDVAEFSQIIKEKTGKAGFVMATTENCGGWDFYSIAMNYGVKWLEKDADGNYKAAFDSQEARDALQYVYDLKWKYNAFPDNTVINNGERAKIYSIYEAAMAIGSPPMSTSASSYEMDPDDIVVISMPGGPAGRYSQIGGGVYMFSSNSTPEQIKGCLEWLAFTGKGPRDLSDEELDAFRASWETSIADGGLCMDREAMPLWTYEDPKKTTVREELMNVDMNNFTDYFEYKAEPVPEPEVCGQEMYSILDGVIQEVLTNKDADIDALITKANNDYQVNYLDKM